MKTINQQGNTLFSRRVILKTVASGLVAAAAGQLLLSGEQASAASLMEGKKVLTVYYSRSGNTRELARQIHAMTGGDIIELETVQPYPEEYRSTTEQAKKELEANFYPPLKVTVDDIGAYDLILVGSPSWWATFASPVRGFLAQHDFSGKKLSPFITHEGSRLGKSIQDMKMLCPGSTVLDGLAVRGSNVKDAQNDISEWLQRLQADS